MTLRAYDPNGNGRHLQIASHLKVPKMLKESQKADFRLVRHALQNETFSHVFVAVVDIGNGFANQHDIDQFLARVAMLIYQTILFKVHFRGYQLTSTSQNH